MNYPGFDDLPPSGVIRSSRLRPKSGTCAHKHAQNFLAYHVANPAVYAEFCKFAEQMRTDTGRASYATKTVMEVLRWHRDVKTSDEDFKINNNYTSFYARMYMHHYNCPKFFSCRSSYADDIEFPEAHRGILRGRLPEAS